MVFLDQAIAYLERLAGQVSLPWFVTIGSFTEELIAPIPSPFVMTIAGSIAAAQGLPLLMLFSIALIGAFAKTVGAWLIYLIVDKLEDVVLERFGKVLGITHKEVESLGEKFSGGWKDDVVLFLLRAVPVVPTAPVSAAAGLIKINMRTYLVSSFLGTIFRNLFYLYLGFTSAEQLSSLNAQLDSVESVGQLLFIVAALGGVGFWIWKKRQDEGFVDRLVQSVQKMGNRFKR